MGAPAAGSWDKRMWALREAPAACQRPRAEAVEARDGRAVESALREEDARATDAISLLSKKRNLERVGAQARATDGAEM
jgi:hypothetical protein